MGMDEGTHSKYFKNGPTMDTRYMGIAPSIQTMACTETQSYTMDDGTVRGIPNATQKWQNKSEVHRPLAASFKDDVSKQKVTAACW
jgi:hypothetical protein